MAKNKIYSNINPYPDREEEIRKAKGNPNKNNHSKKKNSNYGGYTAGTYMAGKLAEKAKQQERVKLPMWLNITLIALFAAIAGLLVGTPVLRLQGDYLAIVTLAFGEIIRNVLNCIYISLDGNALRFSFNRPDLPGQLLFRGPTGATGVNRIATFTAGFLLVLFTLFVVLNLIHSRSGRAIMAIRDNKIAAESCGIDVTKYRMMAFVTSAALAGMGGALFGLNYSTLVPANFSFNASILILVYVVLGGIGNITGSIVAATVLYVLPEKLRAFADYRMLVYAVVLIAVMLLTNNQTIKNFLVSFREKGHEKSGEKGGEAV